MPPTLPAANPDLDDHLGARILDHLALRPGMRVLDIRRPADAARIPPIAHVAWHVADVSALPVGDPGFDLVICGVAIEHAGEMTASARQMWRLVRPGGQLLLAALNPWDAIDAPERLVDMLNAAGIHGGEVWIEPAALFAVARK